MAHMQKDESGKWFLADPWFVDDVLNMRPDLTDDQCVEVLHYLEDNFDANYGINWDVIHYAAAELFPEVGESRDDV
jgi:hypothetical protein